jgi:dTDP-4-dehydrorhamnose reductase
MEKVKKILVLGSSGMLGHILVTSIKSKKNFQLSNIARKKTIHNDTLICDVTDFKKLEENIKKISPDYIINCIGVLINESKTNPKNAILINAYLPHFLESISEKHNFQLIHISTDCVFYGSEGSYHEGSIKDAKDVYGISKGLGEIISPNHLTIRTSIIGPEIKNHPEGLFEWVLKNKSKKIDGYTESIWSGVTTLVLSRGIIYCVENNIKGLLHIASNKISKFDLICIINEVYKLGVTVKKVKGIESDKSLISNREDFLFNIPSHFEMISEMYDFMNQN